jgi:hypothetical protein
MDKQWGDTKLNGCLKDHDKSASGIDHSSIVLSQALRQDIQQVYYACTVLLDLTNTQLPKKLWTYEVSFGDIYKRLSLYN